MGKSESIRAVFAATRNLYPYMLPGIVSLLEHNDVDKIYLLIEDDQMPYEVPKECECINVTPYKDKVANGANARSQFTWMAMIRSLYPTILPHEDKVLQLDVDLVVLDSLKPIWDIDLTGKYFAAAIEPKLLYNPWKHERYFNVGVAVINLAELRKDNFEEKALEMLNNQYMLCVDQDVLNYFEDKGVEFPSRYNECGPVGTSGNPAVAHFAGYSMWWMPINVPGWKYLKKYRHLFKEVYDHVYG